MKLLALLKHPFAAFGMKRTECRRAARFLELAIFRGWRVAGGIAELPAALARARAGVKEKSAMQVPAARRRLADWQWTPAIALAETLARVLAPIEAALLGGHEISVAEASRMLLDALNAAAADESGRPDLLWSAPDGAALATLLDELAGEEGEALAINPLQFADVLATLMADVMVQRPVGADPRIHIWGTLEARLQSVDLLILGGLDEGVWPAQTRTDPWLSRSMRAEIGLPPPERRIGLAAHDFRAGPRRAARHPDPRRKARRRADRALALASAPDGAPRTGRHRAGQGARRPHHRRLRATSTGSSTQRVKPVKRPAPTPPVAARPRSLSITEIENLVRDPYVIYAKRILRLDELEPLGRVPDYALRGSLMHEALGNSRRAGPAISMARRSTRLNEIGRSTLQEVADFPDVHVLWSLRFEAIARWFVDWEAERGDKVERRHSEVSGATAPRRAGRHVHAPGPRRPHRCDARRVACRLRLQVRHRCRARRRC